MLSVIINVDCDCHKLGDVVIKSLAWNNCTEDLQAQCIFFVFQIVQQEQDVKTVVCEKLLAAQLVSKLPEV